MFRLPWGLSRNRTLRKPRKWPYWLPIGLFLVTETFDIKQIKGRSMQPTLNPDFSASNDIALFDRTAHWDNRDYHRDDVVCLKSPEDPKRIVVKRITAVAGDTVKTLPPYPDVEVVVPSGHIWIEGDEPFYSDDSNMYGPVPLGLVESRLVLILWPWHRFGRIAKPSTPKVTMGPEYRRAMAEIDRERRRHERVKVPTGSQ